MTDEFEKALKEEEAIRCDYMLESKFAPGARWAYEWLEKKRIDLAKTVCAQDDKLEALTKEADALAEALADCMPSWLPEGIRNKRREALARWRNFNGGEK